MKLKEGRIYSIKLKEGYSGFLVELFQKYTVTVKIDTLIHEDEVAECSWEKVPDSIKEHYKDEDEEDGLRFSIEAFDWKPYSLGVENK